MKLDFKLKGFVRKVIPTFLKFLLVCSLIMILPQPWETIGLPNSNPVFAENSTGWYLNSSDSVNVTLINGVKISISRRDGLIHWYWPTSPEVDRRFSRWSAIRVETWGYNDGQCFEDGEEITITESTDGSWLLVNETWETASSHRTRISLHMVFHRDLPWFYCYARQTYLVEPNSTTLSYWYRFGLQPQICVFLKGSDSIHTPSPFNSSEINIRGMMPVTFQWMEQFQQFPWIAMHDEDDDAAVGVVVLDVYPPSYDLMGNDKTARNQEAQITFMSAEESGVSEVWYFPKDFYWYAQFVVYPYVNDTSPYYDEVSDLARYLYHPAYTERNFDSSFTSAGHGPTETGQPFIVNKVGCLPGLDDEGVIFWNGTTPRHYEVDHPDNHMLTFNQDYYNISNYNGYLSNSTGWNSTSVGSDSRYGYHVQCWKQLAFDYQAYELDVELKHTWEAWNDSDKFLWTTTLKVKSTSNLTKAYFWLTKGLGEVIQLNSTAWELYETTSWGAEPAITLIFKNSTVEYSNGRWICHLVNNTSQKEYTAGKEFKISFYIWLHYGHITETSQITPIHTIQPEHVAPFHSHFHHSVENRNIGDFAFWTNVTLIDVRVAYLQAEGELTITETGRGVGTTEIYCAEYEEPKNVEVNGENVSYQFDTASRILSFNVSFPSIGKNVAVIKINIPDTTAPETEIVIGYPHLVQNGNLYVNSSTHIQLNATDKGLGIDYTSLKVDNEPWMNFSIPFTLSGHDEGKHWIHYFTVDNTGNIEATETKPVTLDDLPPTTICNPPEGEYYGSVNVNFTSEDNAVGVKETYYRTSSEERWIEYTGPFTITGQGYHEIQYYSIDNLGNRESNKSTSYTIHGEFPWNEVMVATGVVVTVLAIIILLIHKANIKKKRGKKEI